MKTPQSKAVNTNGTEPATSVVVNDDGTFTLGGGADVVNNGLLRQAANEEIIAQQENRLVA